eukprot:2956732-Pleurochrysis_carterae.AAC.2
MTQRSQSAAGRDCWVASWLLRLPTSRFRTRTTAAAAVGANPSGQPCPSAATSTSLFFALACVLVLHVAHTSIREPVLKLGDC